MAKNKKLNIMTDYRVKLLEDNRYIIQERHRFPMRFWWHDAKMGIFSTAKEAMLYIEKEIIPKIIYDK